MTNKNSAEGAIDYSRRSFEAGVFAGVAQVLGRLGEVHTKDVISMGSAFLNSYPDEKSREAVLSYPGLSGTRKENPDIYQEYADAVGISRPEAKDRLLRMIYACSPEEIVEFIQAKSREAASGKEEN